VGVVRLLLLLLLEEVLVVVWGCLAVASVCCLVSQPTLLMQVRGGALRA
jgi:hypothetical protein